MKAWDCILHFAFKNVLKCCVFLDFMHSLYSIFNLNFMIIIQLFLFSIWFYFHPYFYLTFISVMMHFMHYFLLFVFSLVGFYIIYGILSQFLCSFCVFFMRSTWCLYFLCCEALWAAFLVWKVLYKQSLSLLLLFWTIVMQWFYLDLFRWEK